MPRPLLLTLALLGLLSLLIPAPAQAQSLFYQRRSEQEIRLWLPDAPLSAAHATRASNGEWTVFPNEATDDAQWLNALRSAPGEPPARTWKTALDALHEGTGPDAAQEHDPDVLIQVLDRSETNVNEVLVLLSSAQRFYTLTFTRAGPQAPWLSPTIETASERQALLGIFALGQWRGNPNLAALFGPGPAGSASPAPDGPNTLRAALTAWIDGFPLNAQRGTAYTAASGRPLLVWQERLRESDWVAHSRRGRAALNTTPRRPRTSRADTPRPQLPYYWAGPNTLWLWRSDGASARVTADSVWSQWTFAPQAARADTAWLARLAPGEPAPDSIIWTNRLNTLRTLPDDDGRFPLYPDVEIYVIEESAALVKVLFVRADSLWYYPFTKADGRWSKEPSVPLETIFGIKNPHGNPVTKTILPTGAEATPPPSDSESWNTHWHRWLEHLKAGNPMLIPYLADSLGRTQGVWHERLTAAAWHRRGPVGATMAEPGPPLAEMTPLPRSDGFLAENWYWLVLGGVVLVISALFFLPAPARLVKDVDNQARLGKVLWVQTLALTQPKAGAEKAIDALEKRILKISQKHDGLPGLAPPLYTPKKNLRKIARSLGTIIDQIEAALAVVQQNRGTINAASPMKGQQIENQLTEYIAALREQKEAVSITLIPIVSLRRRLEGIQRTLRQVNTLLQEHAIPPLQAAQPPDSMNTSSALDTLDASLASFKKMYEKLRKQAKNIKKKNLANFAKDLRAFHKEANDVLDTLVGINTSNKIDAVLRKEGKQAQTRLSDRVYALKNDLKRYEPASLKNLAKQDAPKQGQLSATLANDALTVLEDEVIVFLKKYQTQQAARERQAAEAAPADTTGPGTPHQSLPPYIADVPEDDLGTLTLSVNLINDFARRLPREAATPFKQETHDDGETWFEDFMAGLDEYFKEQHRTLGHLRDEIRQLQGTVRELQRVEDENRALKTENKKKDVIIGEKGETIRDQKTTISKSISALKQTKEHLEAVQHFEALGKHLNDGYRYFLDASNDVALTTAISHLTKYAFENLVEAVARNRQGDDQRARLMYANLYTITGKLRRYQGRTIQGFAEAYEILQNKPGIEAFATGIEPDDKHPDHKQFQKTHKFVSDRSKSTLNLAPFYYEIDASGRVFGIGGTAKTAS